MMFTYREKAYPRIAPGLAFDEDSHLYTWKGRPAPSVSAILNLKRDFSMIPEHNAQAGLHFGKVLHEALFLLDTDDLDRDSLDPMLLPYIAGYERFKAAPGDYISALAGEMLDTRNMLAECAMGHDSCGYCGTLDRLFAVGKYDVLLDFKSGQANRWTGVQLAGYGRLLLAMGIVRIDRLRMYEITWGQDGTVVARPCKYSTHLNVFNSLLAAHNFATA